MPSGAWRCLGGPWKHPEDPGSPGRLPKKEGKGPTGIDESASLLDECSLRGRGDLQTITDRTDGVPLVVLVRGGPLASFAEKEVPFPFTPAFLPLLVVEVHR